MNARQQIEVTTFSHRSIEYYTPVEYITAARDVMGGIDLDPASCEAAQKIVQAAHYFTKNDDGLAQEWYGSVWLNPPYSKTGGKSNQALWSEKLIDEYENGRVVTAVLLVRAALGYVWFEQLFERYPVCFARERIRFIRPDGTSAGPAKQGAAFFYFGRYTAPFCDVFRRFGRVIWPPSSDGGEAK